MAETVPGQMAQPAILSAHTSNLIVSSSGIRSPLPMGQWLDINLKIRNVGNQNQTPSVTGYIVAAGTSEIRGNLRTLNILPINPGGYVEVNDQSEERLTTEFAGQTLAAQIGVQDSVTGEVAILYLPFQVQALPSAGLAFGGPTIGNAPQPPITAPGGSPGIKPGGPMPQPAGVAGWWDKLSGTEKALTGAGAAALVAGGIWLATRARESRDRVSPSSGAGE